MNFKVQRTCANRERRNFIISFNSPVLSSVSYEVQHLFRRLVLLEMIFFKTIFKTVVEKFAIRCKIILVLGSRPLAPRTSAGFRLK